MRQSLKFYDQHDQHEQQSLKMYTTKKIHIKVVENVQTNPVGNTVNTIWKKHKFPNCFNSSRDLI